MTLTPEDIQPGDELYCPSSISIDHGWDDSCGGIGVVKRVEHNPKYPGMNDYFVFFENLSRGFNLRCLLREQDELEACYRSRMAHDCPENQPCPHPEKFDPETFQLLPIKKKVA